MATCELCPPYDNAVADDEILDHLRLIHPEQYGDGPKTWPDGQLVISDAALEPSDFSGGS